MFTILLLLSCTQKVENEFIPIPRGILQLGAEAGADPSSWHWPTLPGWSAVPSDPDTRVLAQFELPGKSGAHATVQVRWGLKGADFAARTQEMLGLFEHQQPDAQEARRWTFQRPMGVEIHRAHIQSADRTMHLATMVTPERVYFVDLEGPRDVVEGFGESFSTFLALAGPRNAATKGDVPLDWWWTACTSPCSDRLADVVALRDEGGTARLLRFEGSPTACSHPSHIWLDEAGAAVHRVQSRPVTPEQADEIAKKTAGVEQGLVEAETLSCPPPAVLRNPSPWRWLEMPGWVEETPSSNMRAAQFRIPGEGGDASLVVYWFKGGGGTVEENFARWEGQFEGDQQPTTWVKGVAPAVRVNRFRHHGRYQAETSPGSGERVDRPDWAIDGAVIEAPDGPFFAKMVGPAATVHAQERALSDFLALVGPPRPSPARPPELSLERWWQLCTTGCTSRFMEPTLYRDSSGVLGLYKIEGDPGICSHPKTYWILPDGTEELSMEQRALVALPDTLEPRVEAIERGLVAAETLVCPPPDGL